MREILDPEPSAHERHIDMSNTVMSSNRISMDRRIDANELAVEIDQRAARTAGIDGGVGLDEETVVADTDLRARKRRNNALRDRLADTERIADGDDEISDF